MDCLCILCVVCLFFWYRIYFHTIFAFLVHQLCLYFPENCIIFFLMVLSSDLLYPAISITSSFDFFPVHDVLFILLVYHISAASSLLSRPFVSVQHSYLCRRMDHNVGFRCVDCGVNSDIPVGEYGLHLGECVYRQSCYFLYFCVVSDIWSYCEA